MGKWYWIELIGFDREREDFAVGAFFERIGGDAEGVSLLFSNADFVNLHDGVTGKELAPCDCSYSAHPFGEERARQPWRDTELRALVGELKKHGVKVVFSVFNAYLHRDESGALVCPPFGAAHPELSEYDKDGARGSGYCMIKRFADGRRYEDYFLGRAARVVADYGFDGVHLADGVSSPRLSVEGGDFTDDLVGQFLDRVPAADIARRAATEKAYRARRAAILASHRREWLEFLADRWAEFYEKAYELIPGIVIFNQAWTLPPFAAFYQYGVDYTRLHAERAYAMMTEEISANRPIYSAADNLGYLPMANDRRGYPYEFAWMQMACRAALPSLRILPLTPIKDTMEQWDALRHAPTELFRALVRRNHAFARSEGKLLPCTDGPFYCLSDAVSASDWQTLFAVDRASAAPRGAEPCGFSVLWSRERMLREIDRYAATKDYTSDELTAELFRAGLDVGCATDAASLEGLSSPVLVVSYDLLSDGEKAAVAGTLAPVVALGGAEGLDGIRVDAGLPLTIKNAVLPEGAEEELAALRRLARFRPDRGKNYYGFWTAPLPYRRLPRAYFARLAAFLHRLAALPAPQDGVHVSLFRTGEGKYRYLLSNDEYRYSLPRVEHSARIARATAPLKYRGYRVTVKSGRAFVDRVPPRGADLVDVEDETDGRPTDADR